MSIVPSLTIFFFKKFKIWAKPSSNYSPTAEETEEILNNNKVQSETGTQEHEIENTEKI